MADLFSRADKGFLSEWWWSVDRRILLLVIALIGIGFFMAFAATPAVALTIGKPIYYLLAKQMIFLSVALVAFISVSMLSPQAITSLAVAMFIAALVALVATLFVGTTIKGATRWLVIGGVSIQPVEFIKPAFAVIVARLLAEQKNIFTRELGAALALLALVVALLVAQPDFGQSLLLCLLWGSIYFLSGGDLRIIGAALGAVSLAAIWVYTSVGYIAQRIDSFLNPASGNTYQVDKAMDAIRGGGWFGSGLGDGRIKSTLPDAHSDYVFAVAAEEGGLVLGTIFICAFALTIIIALTRLRDVAPHWVQLSAAGLICLFGMQVLINLGVNLNLMPPKGMTLPFISYGGSSLLASAVGMGMLVGLSRKRRSLPTSHAVYGGGI